MVTRPASIDTVIRLLGMALVIGAVLLAGRWGTELTAPRPVAKLPSTPSGPLDNPLAMAGKLFGAGETHSQSLDGLQLVGVFANSRGGGFATFRTRLGSISVFSGGDVAPGVRLKQIERDRVIIISAGIQKELRLSEGGGRLSSPIGQTAAIPPQQAIANDPQGGETGQQPAPGHRIDRPQENAQ